MVQVVRCCIENAASVAKTFLTSNAVVIDRMEIQPLQRRRPMPMPRKPMPIMPRKPMPSSGTKKGQSFQILQVNVWTDSESNKITVLQKLHFSVSTKSHTRALHSHMGGLP